MRITCPLCGTRDQREFYYYGAADYLSRPAEDAGDAAWDDYLHLRDNPAGVTKDLWYHETGCSAWIEVTRNTVTHEILASRLVADRGSSGGAEVPEKRPRRAAGAGAAPPAGKPATKPRAPRGPKGGAA
jgi:sarcosine oxidase subunit delta